MLSTKLVNNVSSDILNSQVGCTVGQHIYALHDRDVPCVQIGCVCLKTGPGRKGNREAKGRGAQK